MKIVYLGTYAAFILLLLLLSCNNDEDLMTTPETEEFICPADKYIGLVNILESSQLFLPYDTSMRNVVFSDTNGNEVIGEIVYHETFSNYTSLRDTFMCAQDSTQAYRVRYDSEARVMVLNIEDIDVSVRFQLFLSAESGSAYNIDPPDTMLISDYLNVHVRTPIPEASSGSGHPNSVLGIQVASRTNPFRRQTEPDWNEYTLHGKVFSNVYYNPFNIQEEKFNILYNQEVGLVGLENYDKSISLKFERIE